MKVEVIYSLLYVILNTNNNIRISKRINFHDHKK